MAKVTWKGVAYQAKVAQIAYHNALRAGQYAVGQVKRSMKRGGQRRVKSKEGHVLGKLPTVHSARGQVPFVQTGRLKNSITARVRREGNTIIAQYGSNVKYAARLEYGFMAVDKAGRRYNQLPRPYLMPVLHAHWKTLQKILTTGRP